MTTSKKTKLDDCLLAAKRELLRERNQGRLDSLAVEMVGLLPKFKKDDDVCRQLNRLIETKESGCLMLDALMLALVNEKNARRKTIANMVESGARTRRGTAASEYAMALMEPAPQPRNLISIPHPVFGEGTQVWGPVHYAHAA